MFHKLIFLLGHEIYSPYFYFVYKKLMRNQWLSYDELKSQQIKEFKTIIDYSYHNIPYYSKLFHSLNLHPTDFKTPEDLQKLPILTKEIIKNNWELFKPQKISKYNYYEDHTGGSTGTPFTYRISKNDRFLNGALLYRGWGYGGYTLSDKMIFLAGASLDIGTKSTLQKSAHEFIRNIKKLSSFDMSEMEMRKYVDIINSFKAKFFRGYASSIYFFAEWIEKNDIKIHSPLATFTTAEKLQPYMRKRIEDALQCEVFDCYGLNDGGVTAFECPEHNGLHIDTERSIMEIVSEEGEQLQSGKGSILATSLHNYAMPFIRYNTGDEAIISNEFCPCGRKYRLLKEIIGRQQEILETPEGTFVHGEFFTHIFWEIKNVKEFQVVQERKDLILIKIVAEEGFELGELNQIREFIHRRSPGWNIEFTFVDKIERTVAGKYKFIINNLVTQK